MVCVDHGTAQLRNHLLRLVSRDRRLKVFQTIEFCRLLSSAPYIQRRNKEGRVFRLESACDSSSRDFTHLIKAYVCDERFLFLDVYVLDLIELRLVIVVRVSMRKTAPLFCTGQCLRRW